MDLLIIDHISPSVVEQLRELPISVHHRPDIGPEEARELLPQMDILILNSKIGIGKELASSAPKLKLIIRAGVGMDHIEVENLEAMGIRVRNTAGANADAVGDQCLGMILSLLNHIHRADRQLRNWIWQREENRGIELGSLCVGIVGYGNTGSAVGRRLPGFGCKVIAYDKYKSGYGDEQVVEASMEQLFAEADMLTLHVPLTAETHQLVNDAYLARFDKPIFLLNLSRGPVVELPALLRGLDTGKLRGAALDVLPNEKLNTLSPEEKTTYAELFSRENVLLTPHIAGWSHQSLDNIGQMILGHVRQLLADVG